MEPFSFDYLREIVMKRHFGILALSAATLLLAAQPAVAEIDDKQFTDMMKKYLSSDQGQEAVANAIQSYARKQQEMAMKAQLDEQFKNPVKVEVGNSPSIGPKDAKITIVEFSDFECPFCKRGSATLNEVKKAYPKDVKVVFKNRPLPMHKNARSAAKASMAAHKQGKFWEYYQKLFDNVGKFNDQFYADTAKELGLDVEKFKADMASPEVEAMVKADEAEADKLDVGGTPAFFVNGVSIQGAQPFNSFKQVIDRWLSTGGTAKS